MSTPAQTGPRKPTKPRRGNTMLSGAGVAPSAISAGGVAPVTVPAPAPQPVDPAPAVEPSAPPVDQQPAAPQPVDVVPAPQAQPAAPADPAPVVDTPAPPVDPETVPPVDPPQDIVGEQPAAPAAPAAQNAQETPAPPAGGEDTGQDQAAPQGTAQPVNLLEQLSLLLSADGKPVDQGQLATALAQLQGGTANAPADVVPAADAVVETAPPPEQHKPARGGPAAGAGKRVDVISLMMPAAETEMSPAELARWTWQLGATSRKARSLWTKYGAAAEEWVALVDQARAGGVPEDVIVAQAVQARMEVPPPLDLDDDAEA